MMKPRVDPSKILGGIIYSIIGGLSSILLGFYIPDVFSGITSVMGEFVIILQTITISGGIITLFGVMVAIFTPKTGGIIIIIGGLVAGLNFISIIGATSIFKKANKQGFDPSDNISQKFLPSSEIHLRKIFSKPIAEFSQFKSEELQPISSFSNKEEGKPEVTFDKLSHEFPPISKLLQKKSSSNPITEVSHLKTEENQSIQSTSEKGSEIIKVTSKSCKICGNELIKNASFCPYCGK